MSRQCLQNRHYPQVIYLTIMILVSVTLDYIKARNLLFTCSFYILHSSYISQMKVAKEETDTSEDSSSYGNILINFLFHIQTT